MSSLERVARQITECGPAPAFGVAGSGATLTLIDHLHRFGCEFVPTHFEATAAIMAGTTGRLSGRAGICLAIKGPGIANMVPGLALATFENFPLVAFVEAYGPGAPAAKAHKRIDQSALTSAVAKGITQIAADGPDYSALAALAEAEAPGPVICELGQPEPDRFAPLPKSSSNPEHGNAARVTALVEKARRPIVVAGTLAVRQVLSTKLNQLKVPVFSTAAAKGIVDESMPMAAGVYTGVGLELTPERSLIANADLVICIGMRPQEVLVTKPFGVMAVNIANSSEPGHEAFAFEAEAGLGAAKNVIALLEDKCWGAEEVAQSHDRLRSAALGSGYLPAHVFQATQRYFDGAVRGVFDTGYFCTVAEHIWQACDASSCLLSGQGRYMGTGLPMGIAAAMQDRSVPTVVFVGDGGIGPFIAEIKIAVERRLPLLLCLLTDGYLSSIRTRALRDHLTQVPVTINRPSWLQIVEAFGLPAYSANDEQSFQDALRAWLPSDGPGYVEVSFDPDAYEAMVGGIR